MLRFLSIKSISSVPWPTSAKRRLHVFLGQMIWTTARKRPPHPVDGLPIDREEGLVGGGGGDGNGNGRLEREQYRKWMGSGGMED